MESENPAHCSSIETHISEQSPRLPEEVIEEILSRLPVKSLLKFKCVSKPWRSLIDSKRFIKKHHDSSTKNPNFAHQNIILNSNAPPHRDLKQCSLLSMLSDPLADQFTSCDLENVSSDSVCIVDCCNGLVCLLLDEQHFMLWNPSTRKTKKLTVFDYNLPVSDHNSGRRGWRISDRGFGYDDSSGDYMVFGMGIVSYTDRPRRYEGMCKVYSLQRNSWKKIEVENASPFHRKGKFASGKIHWIKRRGMDMDIIYFDLRREMFDVIASPFRIGHFNVSMGVLGGRLAMLYDDCVANLYIWVLKEYGVNASWEKVVNIPYLDITLEDSYLFLLGMGPSGEILLHSRSCFEIFCPEGNVFRHSRGRHLGEAVVYVESLVPL